MNTIQMVKQAEYLIKPLPLILGRWVMDVYSFELNSRGKRGATFPISNLSILLTPLHSTPLLSILVFRDVCNQHSHQ